MATQRQNGPPGLLGLGNRRMRDIRPSLVAPLGDRQSES